RRWSPRARPGRDGSRGSWPADSHSSRRPRRLLGREGARRFGIAPVPGRETARPPRLAASCRRSHSVPCCALWITLRCGGENASRVRIPVLSGVVPPWLVVVYPQLLRVLSV